MENLCGMKQIFFKSQPLDQSSNGVGTICYAWGVWQTFASDQET